jgi:ribosomal protein L11 methyltransferase
MTAGEWMSLEIRTPTELSDMAAFFCHEKQSSGTAIEELDDGLTLVRAYFPASDWESVVTDITKRIEDLHALFPHLPKPMIIASPVESEDWAVKWQENFKPLLIGAGLIVSPPWIKPDSQGREIVYIEPAEAFGTGTHETTQGCLILLEEALNHTKSPEGLRMLDIGCGSGILAIAAVKLGLKRVLAVDNDPVAVEAARKNAELNRVTDEITFRCVGLDEPITRRDLVTANLDPKTLLGDKEQIMGLFERYLIISGVPLDQWNDVKAEFDREDVKLVKELTKSEWGCGLFERLK